MKMEKTNYTEENNYCRYSWAKSLTSTLGPNEAMEKLYNSTKDWINVPDMIMNYEDEENIGISNGGYLGIKKIDNLTKILTKSSATSVNNIVIDTIEKPLKARLPGKKEILDTECKTSMGSCPVWLVENLKYYSVTNDKYSINNNNETYQSIHGYWLLPSFNGNNQCAYSVSKFGRLESHDHNNDKNFSGIRPVITVPISDLE